MKKEVRLRQYIKSDFLFLKQWITDSNILFQFAGPDFNFPLSPDQIEKYQKKNADRQFYMGVYGEKVVAFGEIIPQDPGSVRLGRLLVGETPLRGMGIGTKFVLALIDEAISSYKVRSIDLFVIHDNISAIRCYEKAGFQFQKEAESFIRDHNGTKYLMCKMTRNLSQS